MSFEIDTQTKKDLDLFAENANHKSIFSLFDFTTCKGGHAKLYKYLSTPMTDIEAIDERKEAIAYFEAQLPKIDLDFDKDTFDFAQYYHKHKEFSVPRPSKVWRPINYELLNKLRFSENRYVVEKGVRSMVAILKKIKNFGDDLQSDDKNKYPSLFLKNNEKLLEILNQEEIKSILDKKELKPYDIAEYNYVFRYLQYKNMQFIFDLIYEYDALISIAKAAKAYNYTYPEMLVQDETCLFVEGLFHPLVDNAIGNDIEFGRDSNLLFITGPNMAGKSTFLKALGICVYLAHVGFPVPARQFKMSLMSGLCTTINISDNIQSGHSHFYAEVLRVKQVAKQLKNNRNMMVIFDELFRGTNVKDAYDGTLAIVSAFARIKSSFFVISTHIVEVTEELKINKNINFRYFDIKEENGHPVYTYQFKEGMSSDRLGMYIIKKEGVIEMIHNVLEDDNI